MVSSTQSYMHNSVGQFNIIHWYSRSLFPKLDQLKDFLSKLDKCVDMILFNETWLTSPKIIKLPGFNVIRRDSNHPHMVRLLLHYALSINLK